jgi:hypothetical protein
MTVEYGEGQTWPGALSGASGCGEGAQRDSPRERGWGPASIKKKRRV